MEREIEYVTVSPMIFKDLMTAKSKLTDVKDWMHEYENQLAMVHALKPLLEILYGRYYWDDDEHVE